MSGQEENIAPECAGGAPQDYTDRIECHSVIIRLRCGDAFIQ